MSTPRSGGRSNGRKRSGVGSGRTPSLRNKRQKVGTPGPAGKGVEFEAAVLDGTPTTSTPAAKGGRQGVGSGSGWNGAEGSEGGGSDAEAMDTFSYDDVSDLATVTPVAPKRPPPLADTWKKLPQQQQHRPQPQQQEQQQEQQQADEGKRRAFEEEWKAGTSTEEDHASGAAKRRRRRQQEAAEAASAAAAAAAAVATATAAEAVEDTAATTPRRGTGTGTATPRSKHSYGSNGNAGIDAKGDAMVAAVAGAAAPSGVVVNAGVAPKKASTDGGGGGGRPVGGGVAVEASVAAVAADPTSALAAKERQGGSRADHEEKKKRKQTKVKKEGKKQAAENRERRGAKSARKVPQYPHVDLTPSSGSSKARCITDALKIAVTAELQGLLRERGTDPDCKAAVEACVGAGQEIMRQAAEICVGLHPAFRVDLKEARRAFSEQSQRQREQISDEEKLWAIEEQKCLALIESSKRTQAKMQDFDERQTRGHVTSLTGKEELRALLGTTDEDEDGSASPLSDGTETSKRVSDQVLEATNDMIINATAIGRCLQEMGAGVADAQETKERLTHVISNFVFKDYPNAHDPKAGIAAMLK